MSEKSITAKKSFLFHWEGQEKKAVFRTDKQMPFTERERDRLAQVMTFNEVIDANIPTEDAEMRRNRKWQEIQHLFKVIRSSDRYSKGSIENAMWFYGTMGVTVTHFVMAIMNEFKFDRSLQMDAHLRWLYWSFDGGREDAVDWREILACFKTQLLYKMVPTKPAELLLVFYDLFATGGEGKNSHPNSDWYMTRKDLLHMLSITCVSLNDYTSMNDRLNEAIAKDPKLSADSKIIKRGVFRNFLRISPKLVDSWQKMTWLRVPMDLRLAALDNSQVESIHAADLIFAKFQLRKALAFAQFNVYKRCVFQWKKETLTASIIRRFAIKKYKKRQRLMFKFWFKMAEKQVLRRRRRLLAEVMGCYTIKARTFARIKLFNYNTRRYAASADQFDKPVKMMRQGVAHLRYFLRLRDLRYFILHWKLVTRREKVEELSYKFFRERTILKCIREWGKIAHENAHQKRMELLVLENQRHLKDMLQQAEEDGALLVRLELEKANKIKEEKEKNAEAAKQERIEKNRKRIEDIKKDDRRMIESIQRDARKRRCKIQMKRLKKKWENYWKKQYKMNLDRAEAIATEYLKSKDSFEQMEMRFQKLKREFFMPPCPENERREKIITNPMNITLLYLDAKLELEGVSLIEAVAKFDKDGSGHLDYDEFRRLIKALGVHLTPVQIEDVIRGIDADGDGFLEMKELENAMKNVDQMGVPGSKWKFYVDPAQDVICYHNFHADEKVFEYQMKDDKLREINISNYYGEAITETKKKLIVQKQEDWDHRLRNYMVRRIQYMYKVWKCRKIRRSKLDLIKRNQGRYKLMKEKVIMQFFARKIRIWKTKEEFRREYHKTIEKVWDFSTQKMFWYNHMTKQSVWEQPKLVRRYGDVEKPFPWVTISIDSPDGAVDETGQPVKIAAYYHVLGKKQMLRKPDGVFICSNCQFHVSLRRCLDCKANFCFTCYREIHKSPYGFFQKTDIMSIIDDHTQLANQANVKHMYKRVEPKTCKMCQTERIMAAFSCAECDIDALCRPCARRVHAHPKMHHHMLVELTE